MDIKGILTNPLTYLVLAGLGFFFWGTVRRFVGRLPVINKRNAFILVSILFAIAFSSWLGSLGFGSMATGVLASPTIIDVQTTTAAVSNGTATVSTTVPRTTDVRFTDAQATGSGITDFNSTIITLTRSGDLTKAAGVTLACVVPADFVDQDGTTAQTTYQHLIERDSLKQVECYLQNGAVATTTSQKGITTAVFSEGSGTATFGVAFSVDENGHDAMNQYNSLPVQIINSDTKEVLWTYNVFRMD